MAKKSKKGKAKLKVAKQPKNKGGKSAQPSSEMFGLPQWAVIVIVAVIIVILFLAMQGGLTGRYHVPGGSDYVKLSDVTFIPVNSIFIRAGTYSGRISGVRVDTRLIPSNDLRLKFSSDTTTAAYVVTRKIDSTALPVGSIVYYKDGGWRIAQIGSPRLYSGQYYFTEAYLSLVASSTNSWVTYIILRFSQSPSQIPIEFTTVLYDRTVQASANGTILRVNAGEWKMGWDNAQPIDLSWVTYNDAAVNPGYLSSAGSTYRTDSPVTVRYAYDTRRSS